MTFRIVADENMPNVDTWFSGVATSITRKPGRQLASSDLKQADALLVRSVTQVNRELLADTPVRFVGSATIGTDHVDSTYLKNQDIEFHHAPGCNAQSVADWLMSVLSRLHIDYDLDWWNKTIGIVGVGNVGSAVRSALQRCGVSLLLCDPLKRDQGLLPEHVELADLMEAADVVCFHTPHTRSGPYPTEGLVTEAILNSLKDGSWVINAGRGPVILTSAIEAHSASERLNFILDVWPEEPKVPEKLLGMVKLASPHVAGYSLEGKLKGTEMLAEAFFNWLGQEKPEPNTQTKKPALDARLYEQKDIKKWASELVLGVYDPARDTVAMRASLHNGAISSEHFDQLRKEYPTRRELKSVLLKNAPQSLVPWLEKIGFQIG